MTNPRRAAGAAYAVYGLRVAAPAYRPHTPSLRS